MDEIPVGVYDCIAAAYINGKRMSVTVSQVKIEFYKPNNVILDLQEPDDWYREVIFEGATANPRRGGGLMMGGTIGEETRSSIPFDLSTAHSRRQGLDCGLGLSTECR